MPAIPYKKTPVNTDDAWDAGKAEAALSNDADSGVFRKEYAWVDASGDEDTKSAYKFPHHFVGADGTVGAASSQACSAGIAALNGGRGGAKIPDGDREAVYSHLAHHLKDAKLEPPKLNSFEDEKRKETFSIDKNAFTADDKTGTLTFPMGQVLMDGSTLRSGAKYDMDSLDPSEFNGSVTVDHAPFISAIVAKTQMVKRGGALLMNAIQFAVKENPLAQVSYDLYKNGYAHDFSIETYGAAPDYDEDGDDENQWVFKNAKVCGLSCVVTGNSPSATMSLIRNSLETARKNGLDTKEAEQQFGVNVSKIEPEEVHQDNINHKQDNGDMKFVTVENNRDFAIKLKYKNAAEKEIETELAPGASVDVSEDQKEAVENQIKSAVNTAAADEKVSNAINTAVEAVDKKWGDRFDELQKNLLDNSAEEPKFHPNKQAHDVAGRHLLTNSKLEDMGWEERTAQQMQDIYRSQKYSDPEATRRLWAINAFNLDEMKKSDKKYNALSIEDLGNFVIPPELITKIFGHVSNFQPLVSQFNFQETLSMITSWIVRDSRLVMSDVDIQDEGNNQDLKAESVPTYETHTATLSEFASVTPVDASAIRFSAADIMQDITMQYRVAYDQALATSIVGRLVQAVNSTSQSENFNTSVSAVDALTSMLDIWSPIVEWVPNGVFMMTQATVLQLMKYALQAGPNGPLSNIFTTGQDNVPRFFNLPYVVVPTAVMPSLNTATAQQPSLTFEGQTVTSQYSILLANPENFMGRVSGGLQFQVSTEAAYEENGTVKSAFQRDKLVFRGYGYRKSAVTLLTDVAGVTSVVVS